MAQSVSVDYRRKQASYWNAELALAISQHYQGKVNDRFLSLRIRAVSNIQHKKEPLSHRFTGKKAYSHD